MTKISTHKDLRVYQLAFELSMKIYKVSKSFPVEEKYSLKDQVRRSSRSVCANLAEAFRKEDIQRILSLNCLIAKLKLPKLKFG